MLHRRLGLVARLAAIPTFVIAALSLPACGRSPEHRVLVLGIDGTDPRAIDLLISEGRLPNFTKLRSEGAYGRLRSQKPLLSPVIWTTIATGKTPEDHGIGHFVAVDEETGEQLPATSDMRKVKALWNVASEKEKKVAVVGWWATWPPEEINGSMVSDHTAYHFLFEEGETGGSAGQVNTYPPSLQQQT
jgi:predicted AlkP superfamily pyrophosphatase or phosphodiesterase